MGYVAPHLLKEAELALAISKLESFEQSEAFNSLPRLPKSLQPFRLIALLEDDVRFHVSTRSTSSATWESFLWGCLGELLGFSPHVRKFLSLPTQDCCSLRAGGMQSSRVFPSSAQRFHSKDLHPAHVLSKVAVSCDPAYHLPYICTGLTFASFLL